MNGKILKKLRTISKSKMGSFLNCRYGFKLNYIDGLPADPNPFLKRGTDVHNFHETFLKRVIIKDGKLVIPDFKTEETITNANYKRNILHYHIDRWKKCLEEKGEMHAEKYFMPIVNEEKILLPHLELIGIPDVVERGFDDKPVPVEVKTGTPNARKVKDYKHDLVWYKLLFEAKYPDYPPIDRGLIYFPESNYTYTHTITDADVMELSRKIAQVRQDIVECIEKNTWPATPETNKCGWCLHRKKCEYKK